MAKCLLPALLISLTGCATIIQGHSQKLLITSDPPGALISVDGVPQGNAPVLATVARKVPHTLSAVLDGQPGDSLIITPRSNSGLLATNLMNPYGFPVDLITGAHRYFPQEHIRFQLASRDSGARGEGQRVDASRPPLPIGARVRVMHAGPTAPTVTIGTLRDFSTDTLTVESQPPSVLMYRIPLTSARSIDLSMGSTRALSSLRWAGRGALYGWALGAVVGGVMYGLEGAYWFSFLYGLGGGGIGGALFGAVAGQSDRWLNVCSSVTDTDHLTSNRPTDAQAMLPPASGPLPCRPQR